MKSPESGSVTSTRIGIVQSILLLAVAVFPWPACWDRVRGAVDSARSPELNRAEREGHAAGYYEGLIGGNTARSEGTRGDPALRLTGKPTGWVSFREADVVHYLDDDFLQFELKPLLERNLFGQPFLTNAFGMHDDPISLEKARREQCASPSSARRWTWDGACVTRRPTSISSKQWLKNHAARHNLAPGTTLRGAQFRRRRLQPHAAARGAPTQGDGVSARPGDLFGDDARSSADGDPPLRHASQERRPEIRLYQSIRRRAHAIDSDDVRLDRDGDLINKDRLKKKLRPFYWWLYDVTLGAIAAECRAAGVPLVMVIIPRVGKADVPSLRAEPVARLTALAAHQGLTVFDLSDTFDQLDPAKLEIAAWDDHPNAIGHHRLFLALARALVKDQEVYRLLFSRRNNREHLRTPLPQTLAGAGNAGSGRGSDAALRCDEPSQARQDPGVGSG